MSFRIIEEVERPQKKSPSKYPWANIDEGSEYLLQTKAQINREGLALSRLMQRDTANGMDLIGLGKLFA